MKRVSPMGFENEALESPSERAMPLKPFLRFRLQLEGHCEACDAQNQWVREISYERAQPTLVWSSVIVAERDNFALCLPKSAIASGAGSRSILTHVPDAGKAFHDPLRGIVRWAIIYDQ
jgi:hypothetical protein